MIKHKYLPKHHALLYSYILKNCIKVKGEACVPFLKDATISYGKSRGRRMAKKAMYDGVDCNALSYLSYGELDISEDIIERKLIVNEKTPYVLTTKCPWYDAWNDQKHIEYGKIFCEVFDEALANGFGETVNMKVPETIAAGNHSCKFVFEKTKFTLEEIKLLKTRNERLEKKATKPMIYHMAHLLYCMENSFKNEYGEEGLNIISSALVEYENYFGEEIVDDIRRMTKIDFMDISDYK